MMLTYDPDFQVRCLMLLYDRQTLDEQQAEHSIHQNRRGFNSSDAPVLSEIAEAVRSSTPLTPKDHTELTHRLHKYAQQIAPLISDEELLSS